MVEMVEHIIVRAFNAEVEHFYGDDIEPRIDVEGRLRIVEKEKNTTLGVFQRWEYVRNGS